VISIFDWEYLKWIYKYWSGIDFLK